uniref:succinate dehydrogenase subunit 3 n=1 Tax=Antithamnionella miharai TaxID=536589 RepID=UPI002E79105F|nr:succinate dehydrogenase subunit 3 [Antithamnionella miharai]WQF69353.1 succinate dehydrogenase subunit 3 [Antithamnionella miharai]WQF69378.1 succinate dehydrogenase subunit 3 [Antithamnionella miharai]
MISKRKLSRPISPHLLVYKPQNSSLMSIWHRFSGLYITVVLIVLIVFFKFSVITTENLVVYTHCTFWPKILKFVYGSLLLCYFFHLNKGIFYLKLSLSSSLIVILIVLNLCLIYKSLF